MSDGPTKDHLASRGSIQHEAIAVWLSADVVNVSCGAAFEIQYRLVRSVFTSRYYTAATDIIAQTQTGKVLAFIVSGETIDSKRPNCSIAKQSGT